MLIVKTRNSANIECSIIPYIAIIITMQWDTPCWKVFCHWSGSLRLKCQSKTDGNSKSEKYMVRYNKVGLKNENERYSKNKNQAPIKRHFYGSRG